MKGSFISQNEKSDCRDFYSIDITSLRNSNIIETVIYIYNDILLSLIQLKRL